MGLMDLISLALLTDKKMNAIACRASILVCGTTWTAIITGRAETVSTGVRVLTGGGERVARNLRQRIVRQRIVRQRIGCSDSVMFDCSSIKEAVLARVNPNPLPNGICDMDILQMEDNSLSTPKNICCSTFGCGSSTDVVTPGDDTPTDPKGTK